MSDLSRFLKKHKIQKSNAFFPATKSLLDESGQPVKWEIKPLSTREDEEIRDECTLEIPVAGRPNQFRTRLDVSAYIAKSLAAAVVSPDLYNAALQDSYGVKTPEELIREMVDDPGEYAELSDFVQRISGFNVSMDDQIDRAKN